MDPIIGITSNDILVGDEFDNLMYGLAGDDTLIGGAGGDLAYQYNLNGTLAGIGLASAQTVINDASFGVSAHQLHPLAGLQTGTARLG